MLFLGVSLPLKEPLVATLCKTRALISRKYEDEQGMNVPNFSEMLKLFCAHSTVLALEKYSQKCKLFRVFLPLKELLLATLSETCD